MTIFCHLRVLIRSFVKDGLAVESHCPCQFHRYSRNLDEWIADWEREQEAAKVAHKDGAYR